MERGGGDCVALAGRGRNEYSFGDFVQCEQDVGCFGGLPAFLQLHWCGGFVPSGFRHARLTQYSRRLLKVTVGILGPIVGRRGQQNY